MTGVQTCALPIYAAEYIKEIPYQRWTTIDAPLEQHPRFSQLTSNSSESFWSAVDGLRRLNPVIYLFSVLERIGTQIFQRSNRCFQTSTFTDYCVAVYEQELAASRYFQAQPYTNTLAVVKQGQGEFQCNAQKVDLEKQVCTCAKWQDMRIPCRHAIAFLETI